LTAAEWNVKAHLADKYHLLLSPGSVKLMGTGTGVLERLQTRTPLFIFADGYSTSRTCEMSMSNHSGINFRGMVYLIDEATKAKKVSDTTSAHA
jgi:hypothetical protein